MDEHVAEREQNVIRAASDGGGAHILKLFGAVKHDADALMLQHTMALDSLLASGLPWTLISPNSVMETSLLPCAQVAKMDCIMGISGRGRVGLVALGDVTAVTRAVLLGEGHEGRNYECTGPAALSMYDVAKELSSLLGRRIAYYDLSEQEFVKNLLRADPRATRDSLEMGVLCHLRAWRDGRADLTTGTVAALAGRPPLPVAQSLAANRSRFDLPRTAGDMALGVVLKMMYGSGLIR
jgi:uncharacterized protein YbjT (DUF2867 family)